MLGLPVKENVKLGVGVCEGEGRVSRGLGLGLVPSKSNEVTVDVGDKVGEVLGEPVPLPKSIIKDCVRLLVGEGVGLALDDIKTKYVTDDVAVREVVGVVEGVKLQVLLELEPRVEESVVEREVGIGEGVSVEVAVDEGEGSGDTVGPTLLGVGEIEGLGVVLTVEDGEGVGVTVPVIEAVSEGLPVGVAVSVLLTDIVDVGLGDVVGLTLGVGEPLQVKRGDINLRATRPATPLLLRPP